MFYHLLYPLRDIYFGFNVFRYITFRAAGAAITALLVIAVCGRPIISWLRALKIGETVRRKEDCGALHELHKDKEGTPTMGGILILLAISGSVLLWADMGNRYIWMALATMAWLGFIGFMDDFIKLTRRAGRGLRPVYKIFAQLGLGITIGALLYGDPNVGSRLDIPFFKNALVLLGPYYILFASLVIVGASNAVNLTDGLDGLAIGCVLVVALAYSGLSYVTGHSIISDYLQIIYIPHMGELAVFCAAMFGAGLGFLWFNCHPAEVFMGDTGALALGGALGAVALLIKKELLLVLVGGIFVAEAVSVILQVVSFRYRKKRIFLMAPLHHHFQLKGWPESKVIFRFLIVAVALALLSLSSLKLR